MPASDGQKSAAAAQSGDLIGKTIGGCRVDKMLGRGAMGAVYKARQLKLDRDVAVKVIRPEMMTDPRMLKRFEVEARTVGKFNSANVVMVHDVGFELGVHYLVMEFVSGKNLREHVKMLAGGRLPVGEALPLIRQACKGLDEARRLGVVHRDIKPDNLMLTDQGVLKIADFGIAKPVQDDFSMTLTSELIGTPLYMSPEQCQGGADIDFRSDMYSLGATFFYLLTGEPPIRASSVYELIQTKTKLENLCLWKALPELDENNPLSRVIERMTANDREDRYESYEELLNDLVLVEAGETIRTRVRRIKKAQDERDTVVDGRGKPEPKGGSGLLVALLAVVVLGGAGGGYWWWSQQQGLKKVDPPIVDVDPNGGDVDAARARLGRLRERLRTNGPDGLADELAAAKVPAELAAGAQRLAADVAAAATVQQQFAALERPEPTPPFDDVEEWFASVDEAAKVDGEVGPEAREWLEARRREVRAEAELGPLAVSSLLAAWSSWQAERGRVGGDEAALAALGTRLQTIAAGRIKLIDLLPTRRDAINRGLTAKQLQEAEENLTATEAPPAFDADAAVRLAAYRKRFVEEGPAKSLRDSVDAIRPGTEEDRALKTRLVEDIDAALTVKRQVEGIAYPVTPTLPFQDVEDFHKRIDLELSKLPPAEPTEAEATEGALPQWAAELRATKRDDPRMQGLIAAACAGAFLDLKSRATAGTALAELTRQRTSLTDGLARAQRLFPGEQMAASLTESAPMAELDAAMAKAEADAMRGVIEHDLDEVNDRLLDVGSLTDWAEKQEGLDRDVAGLRERLAKMPDATDLQRRLDKVADGCESWRTAQSQLQQVATLFRGGELTQCTSKLAVAMETSKAGVREFGRMQSIVDACRSAFDVLGRELDLQKARAELDKAQGVLAASTGMPPEVAARLRAWTRGLEALANDAAAMVPIPAGDGVDAFFVARTECSIGQFRAFQKALAAAATGATPAEKLASVQDRLPGVEQNPALFGELLSWEPRGDDSQPVDRVRWFEADVYCRFRGESLPTKREWLLAAFGPGNRNKFSWGSEWSNDKDDRNTVYRTLANVDDGGLSWRKSDGHRLHHMSDNVAEWLADPDGARGEAAGGHSFRRPGATAREHCSGEKFEELSLVERRSGVGFRAVLRPKSYPALEWPK